jgi:hypothetical protein
MKESAVKQYPPKQYPSSITYHTPSFITYSHTMLFTDKLISETIFENVSLPV